MTRKQQARLDKNRASQLLAVKVMAEAGVAPSTRPINPSPAACRSLLPKSGFTRRCSPGSNNPRKIA